MENGVRKLIRETLQEIDWEGDFSDVKQKCLNPQVLVDYLNRVRANASKDYPEREKFKKGKPFVHAKSSFFRKGDTEVDIDYFISQITARPKSVISMNEKMTKSGGPHDYVYNTGVPSFRGIVYDKDRDKFHLINTCPGAGDCVFICYALKGNYIRYPAAYDNMTKRLNFLLNHPDQYEDQLYKEISFVAEEHKAFEGYFSRIVIRWNDSGDFFGKKYVEIADRVMERLRDNGYNVESYAYTKVANVANQSSIDTAFSSGANKKQTGKVDLSKMKNSVIVPKEIFKGLNLMRVDDSRELKNRVAKHYSLNPKTVITYDEMKVTPESDALKWNVIVTPKDGDDAAFRKDVKTIYLTQH